MCWRSWAYDPCEPLALRPERSAPAVESQQWNRKKVKAGGEAVYPAPVYAAENLYARFSAGCRQEPTNTCQTGSIQSPFQWHPGRGACWRRSSPHPGGIPACSRWLSDAMPPGSCHEMDHTPAGVPTVVRGFNRDSVRRSRSQIFSGIQGVPRERFFACDVPPARQCIAGQIP